jgi:hypothetical protein
MTRGSCAARGCVCIFDRGIDLQSITNDPRIGEQFCAAPYVITRDALDHEIERLAESIALLENRQPRKACLLISARAARKTIIVVHGKPLVVVIGTMEGWPGHIAIRCHTGHVLRFLPDLRAMALVQEAFDDEGHERDSVTQYNPPNMFPFRDSTPAMSGRVPPNQPLPR